MYKKMWVIMKPILLSLLLYFFSFPVHADAIIKEQDGYIYIQSNGLPNHTTGNFPNAGNPHSISAQNYKFKINKAPVKQPKTIAITNDYYFGVVLNGVPFDAGTAEYYNRDRSSGWVEEGIINGVKHLGIDHNNAHVQPNGAYHYHGIPTALLNNKLEHIGYAADGFKIYIDPQRKYKSSYRLKIGPRPAAHNTPSGRYDGTYTQDFEYKANHGSLDKCNGTEIEGEYSYILTVDFPYIPRCWHGRADSSFKKQKMTGNNRNRHPTHIHSRSESRPPPHHMRHHPPPHHR